MQAHFDSWQNFFAMGGYAFYVWGAYGAMVLSFILGFGMAVRQKKHLLNNRLQCYSDIPCQENVKASLSNQTF